VDEMSKLEKSRAEPKLVTSSAPLAEAMLQNLRQRFSHLLQPSDPNFNPLPASACLLDPTCAAVMLGFDQLELREAAKKHIVQEVNNNNLYFASMT
jgi:hypothetical protein